MPSWLSVGKTSDPYLMLDSRAGVHLLATTSTKNLFRGSVPPRSAAPRVVRNKPTAPGLAELADRLSDRLETRVKVDLGKAKGKITVEFASLDDLRRIVDIMDPRNRNDRPI